MKQTLTFNVSTIGSTASKLNVDAYDESLDAFDNKEYLKSFQLLLDYINPAIRSKYGNVQGTEFSIPHGSIVVNIKIEDNLLEITAPFLKLPKTNRIPLMRQTAGLNFRHIDLAQIELKNEKLQFEYTCPIELVSPYKMYYILKEICITGDKYDDEFSTKFGAERIYEPKIVPYQATTVDLVYETIQSSYKECMEGLTYFENERKYGYAWNIVACTILKILYYAHPQGQLLNDLNKAIEDLDREDIPLSEVVNIGKKVVERLQKMAKEELAEDLYYVETFVSDKRRSSLSNIQENFQNTYEKVSTYIDQGDYMATCVMITYQFYNMYFYNDVQDDVNLHVVNALARASAQTWEKAAPILYKAMKDIMDGNIPPANRILGGLTMNQYMEKLQQDMKKGTVSGSSSGGGFFGFLSSLFGGK